MESSVFVEFKFWLLIVVSIIAPVVMYLLQRRKNEASPSFVLIFGLVLIAISGMDVYLLQTLAAESRLSHSLMDNAIFNSEMSLSLYAFPLLFGGIGINMISDMLVGHLMNAERRYEERHATPASSTPGRRRRMKVLRSPLVQRGKFASTSLRVVLSVTSHETLYRKLSALIESMEHDSQVPGISLDELLSPTFMAAFTRFGSIEEMFEAGGFSATLQEDGKLLSGDQWDAFVFSTTRFIGCADMLQSACYHWLAQKFYRDHTDQGRPGAPSTSAWAVVTIQPTQVHQPGGSSGARYVLRGKRRQSRARDEGIWKVS